MRPKSPGRKGKGAGRVRSHTRPIETRELPKTPRKFKLDIRVNPRFAVTQAKKDAAALIELAEQKNPSIDTINSHRDNLGILLASLEISVALRTFAKEKGSAPNQLEMIKEIGKAQKRIFAESAAHKKGLKKGSPKWDAAEHTYFIEMIPKRIEALAKQLSELLGEMR